jgi:glucose 1-dehydrogenase
VVIADTIETPLEGGPTTKELIEQAGGTAFHIQTDIADWNAVDRMLQATIERFGRLDVMVNNAAIYTSTNLPETTPEQWAKVIGVNLTGFFYCCKRAVGQMLGQEPLNGVRGSIVNISSQHGMVACPDDFPYSVSKGGIVQMTRQSSIDHADDLIVCNAIAPAHVNLCHRRQLDGRWRLDGRMTSGEPRSTSSNGSNCPPIDSFRTRRSATLALRSRAQ